MKADEIKALPAEYCCAGCACVTVAIRLPDGREVSATASGRALLPDAPRDEQYQAAERVAHERLNARLVLLARLTPPTGGSAAAALAQEPIRLDLLREAIRKAGL